MYGTGTKIFFGFMVATMVMGYPLILLSSLPAFQNLLLGSTSGTGAQTKLVETNRDILLDNRCTVADKPTGDRLKRCKDALEQLQGAYQALATPEQPDDPTEQPATPENSTEYLGKSLEAAQLLVALDPKDRDSQRLLATTLANQGKFAPALPLYRALVKREPEPDLYFAYAGVAQSANELDEAIAAYRKFMKLAPEDSRVDVAKESIKSLEEQQSSGGGGINLGSDLGGLGGITLG